LEQLDHIGEKEVEINENAFPQSSHELKDDMEEVRMHIMFSPSLFACYLVTSTQFITNTLT